MRIVVMAVAILAAAGWAGGARAQDCGLKQYDSIPLEERGNQLLLPVTIGTMPGKMALSLQNAASALSLPAVKALDLRESSLPSLVTYHYGGVEIDYLAHAHDVHFGHQTLADMEFLAVPGARFRDGVIGDIGMHMFEKVDFELDIAGGKFNLFSPDHCPGNTVYWTKTGFAQLPLKPSDGMGYIRTDVMLDGHPLTVAFSTDGRSRMGMNAMRRIFGIDATSPELVPVGEDLLGHKTYRYTFKALTADGLTINNPAIMVYDEEPRPACNDKLHFKFPDQTPLHSTEQPVLAQCFGGTDAVLGLSVLRKLRIYVSTKEKLLYLTGADAH